MRLSLVLVGAAACLAGCGTFVTTTPLNETTPEMTARAPRAIAVFSSGPPARPHVDVALLQVEQTHSLNVQGTDVMLDRLREQAGALGCDAVVLGGFSEHQGALIGSSLALLDPDTTTLHATCIVFTDKRSRPNVQSNRRPEAAARDQNVDREEPSN